MSYSILTDGTLWLSTRMENVITPIHIYFLIEFPIVLLMDLFFYSVPDFDTSQISVVPIDRDTGSRGAKFDLYEYFRSN